jgi:hypothetical protein
MQHLIRMCEGRCTKAESAFKACSVEKKGAIKHVKKACMQEFKQYEACLKGFAAGRDDGDGKGREVSADSACEPLLYVIRACRDRVMSEEGENAGASFPWFRRG